MEGRRETKNDTPTHKKKKKKKKVKQLTIDQDMLSTRSREADVVQENILVQELLVLPEIGRDELRSLLRSVLLDDSCHLFLLLLLLLLLGLLRLGRLCVV